MLSTFFLLTVFLITAYSLFHWGKTYDDPNNILHAPKGTVLPMARKEWLIFLLLMTFSFIIRLWEFGAVPAGINLDEAFAAVDARALSLYGTDHYGIYMPVYFKAWGYGQMSVLMSYCMIPFIKLFGFSTVTVRIPILLISMIGLGCIYFLIRTLFGIQAARITLFLASVNPWHFIQSRWALDCNMLPHIFLLAMTLLLIGLQKKHIYIYVSMFFFALCMYSYAIAFYTVPVFLLIMSVYILSKKILKWSQILINVFLYFLFSWPIYLTMFLNAFKLPTIETPFFTMPSFPESVRSKDILFFSDHKLQQLQQNIQCMINIFKKGDELIWNCIPGYGIINLCFVPFIFLGIYYVIHLFRNCKDAVKKTEYFCLLCFFGIGIFAGLITSNPNINRVNIFLYSLILFAGIGIYFTYVIRKRLYIPIAAIYLVLSATFLRTYFGTYAQTMYLQFSQDFIDAVRYIADNSQCNYYVITPDSQLGGSDLISEAITLYALDVDALYFQGKVTDEDGLTYSEKFRYLHAEETDIDPSSSTAYVITSKELNLFSDDDYEITQFINYYSVIPKR